MSQASVYLASAVITLGIQLSGFAVAFALQTEVFYDVLGGLNYLAIAAYSFLQPESPGSSGARRSANTLIFVCSRAWLCVFLAWRAHDRKGDARFDGVKEKFWHFLLFWTVQGVWVLLISMPMLFINSVPSQTELSTFDWLAMLGFALGVLIEVSADVQKTLWIKSGRPGGFCTAGLWSFSRHPNYFGEMLQWWCSWAFAYSSGSGVDDLLWWACIASPAFTMHVLLNIPATGIAQANGKNLKRYYEQPDSRKTYSEYRESTSILIPMIGYRYVPKLLKQTLLFDFARYEYRGRESSESSGKAD
eukprot:TRINITY_DN27444_c0_g2_i1.p1 TRINITY_DN27444_c0_g2~~TRINITY_DN27444_c0_g2_i1.p1  ORF type:complete len:304 (-),score=26.85 TRINITY_DN27444_c0_g2_i1:135-1046(-)